VCVLAVRAGGGLGAFTQLIIAEANSVLHVQAAALGANVALNYRLVPRESTLCQATYVLASISADAVELAPEEARRGHPGGRALAGEPGLDPPLVC